MTVRSFTILIALVFTLPQYAASQMIETPNVYSTLVHGFPQAVKANGFLFLSGQVGWDKEYKLTGKGSFEDQAQQSFKNIELILREEGQTMDQVVHLRIFVTEMSIANKKTVNALIRRYFSENYKPTTSLIGVKALARDELMIEIEAIAKTN